MCADGLHAYTERADLDDQLAARAPPGSMRRARDDPDAFAGADRGRATSAAHCSYGMGSLIERVAALAARRGTASGATTAAK